MGNRTGQASEIIAPLRQRKNLSPLTAETLWEGLPKVVTVADCRRKWALEAVEGGNLESAKANVWQAISRGPWQRANWACWHYIRSLRPKVGKLQSDIR
jgi:hypothetical protein